MSLFARIASRFIVPAAVAESDVLRAAFDVETDDLVTTATTIHCLVIVDLDSGEVFEYGPERIDAGLAHLACIRYLIGHNALCFDLPVLRRLKNWVPPPDTTIIDTLVAGRLILPHIADLDDQVAAMNGPKLGKLRGRHSLEAWGARLGFPKVGADITDFSQWTPELQQRCVGDTKLTCAVWRFLQPDGYEAGHGA
jgi:DNA polymerase-1